MSIEHLLERVTSASIPASERMKALCSIEACATAADADSLERTLTAVLYHDTNPIVRHEAAFILGKLYRAQRICGTRALMALCEAADSDESVVVRHEALEALAAFPDERALYALHKALSDPSADVIATAIISLHIQTSGRDTDGALPSIGRTD